MELNNTSLIHEEALMDIIKALEWGWPAGPSFLYSLGSFIEASVIHDKVFFDPMRQTLRDNIGQQTIPDLLNQSPFVQSMVGEGILKVFPEKSEVAQHLHDTKRQYSFDDFLLDYYWGPESFSSANPEGEVSSFAVLLFLIQRAPAILTEETLIESYMTTLDYSMLHLTPTGFAALSLGFTKENMTVFEALIRKARGYLELTHNLGINFYPALLAIPYQIGSVKAFNSKAKSLYGTIEEKIVSIDEKMEGQDEFSRVAIPPLSQIVLARAKDSITGLKEEILELRHRTKSFRQFLTDYERQWNSAVTRADRSKLSNEFDNAWKTFVVSQERPTTRIIYIMWDILKKPWEFLQAAGDKLRERGHELSIIGKVRGLHDFWSELANSPVPERNFELLSNLFPAMAPEREWELSRDLANSVNALMKKMHRP
jgi:hypothetical protein